MILSSIKTNFWALRMRNKKPQPLVGYGFVMVAKIGFEPISFGLWGLRSTKPIHIGYHESLSLSMFNLQALLFDKVFLESFLIDLSPNIDRYRDRKIGFLFSHHLYT